MWRTWRTCTTSVLVFIHRPHQPGISLLDDVQEAQTAIAIFLCDGNHQPQVPPGQLAFGLFVIVKDFLNGLDSLPQQFGVFMDKVDKPRQFFVHNFDVFGGDAVFVSLFNFALKLALLFGNMLELFH